MADFPDGVIIEILSWLPVKSLLQFKCVSKQWKTSINDSHFIKLHLNRSIQDPNNHSLITKKDTDLFNLYRSQNLESSPEICSVLRFGSLVKDAKVICYCNGLVCLSYETTTFILNPSTRELTRLPDAPFFQHPNYRYSTPYPLLGLGYSSTTELYKVVRCVSLSANDLFDDVYPRISPSEIKQIMVHTVGTASWRSVTGISEDILDEGVFLNGALHWLENFKPKAIISFDIETEKSINMHMPMPRFEGYGDSSLGVLKGLLCLCCMRPCAPYVEIWLMNQYGVEESWAKIFNIEMEYFYFLRPLAWIVSGVLITKHDAELSIYDPRTESVRRIPDMNHTVAFVESLVSLKSQVKS